LLDHKTDVIALLTDWQHGMLRVLQFCPESETISNKTDGEANGDDGDNDNSKPDETVKVTEGQTDSENPDGEGNKEGAAELEETKTDLDEPKKDYQKICGAALC